MSIWTTAEMRELAEGRGSQFLMDDMKAALRYAASVIDAANNVIEEYTSCPRCHGNAGVALPCAPRRWIERWHGSGPDRGWWVWEADHGDSIAYCGEGEFAERLCSLVVQKHNAASGVALPSTAAAMAAEYQAWIDFFHAGGSYDDFLRQRLATSGAALDKKDQPK